MFRAAMAMFGGVGLAAASMAQTVQPSGAVSHPGVPGSGGWSERGGYLVDYGSQGGGSGYSISGANAAFQGFTQFQPFTVTDAGGWDLDSVGIYGFTTFNPSGGAAIGAILGDSGGMPDEGSIFADGLLFNLPTFGDGGAWVDASVDLILAPGTYWVRMAAPDPDYTATAVYAIGGPDGYSRRNNDGSMFLRTPVALRVAGEVVPAPGSLALLGLAGLAAGRRRRS